MASRRRKPSAWWPMRARKPRWNRAAPAKSCASEAAGLAVFGASKLLGREIDAKAHADLLDKLALEIERG